MMKYRQSTVLKLKQKDSVVIENGKSKRLNFINWFGNTI